MAKRKTSLEKIQAIRAKIKVLGDQIDAIQKECEHAQVKTVREIVGYNGYGNDYTSHCRCQQCDKTWFHDGYCSGDHRGL